MAFYIGVDIGGTNIKAGVVGAEGNIVGEADLPTGSDRPQEVVFGDILEAAERAIAAAGVPRGEIHAVGVGCPGTVVPASGVVVYNNNLGWKDFPLGRLLGEALSRPVRVENDANAAALGEVCAGSAKGASSAMILTLGTGVGSGFVVDGRIWTGWSSAASEFGHMVIVRGGRPCTCGRLGCLEAYASATGLIAMTREAMAEHPESLMNVLAAEEGRVGGHTSFVAAERGDAAALRVVDEYVASLACGVTNIVNGLQPEVVSLGGGVGKQGERLLEPLRRKVYAEVYGGCGERFTRLTSCTLGYKAGLIGAAMAAMQSAGD